MSATEKEAVSADPSSSGRDDRGLETSGGAGNGDAVNTVAKARTSPNELARVASSQRKPRTVLETMHHYLFWTPPNCRYDPENPPEFTMGLNFLFSFVSHHKFAFGVRLY